MINKEGQVRACSHTFRLSSGYQFLIEFYSRYRVEYIVVKEPKLQEWHQQIELLGNYMMTNLEPVLLPVGNRSVKALSTSPQSALKKLEEEEHKEKQYEGHIPSLISCKATVTSVIDAEAGIYQLNSRMKLYITFLKGLTGEFWDDNLGSPKCSSEAENCGSMCTEATCEASSTTCQSKCLAVGDAVKVIRCHYIKKKKEVSLVCCGQSHVINMSNKLTLHTSKEEKCSWLINAVHSFNLGLEGLLWLMELRKELNKILSPHILQSSYYSSQVDGGEPHILITLLRKAEILSLVKKKPRCLVEEFLHPAHQCQILQDFVPPFKLESVKEILNGETENINADDCGDVPNQQVMKALWKYSISPVRRFPPVLVGRLVCGEGGVLQLQQTETRIDIVVVGDTGMNLSKLGIIVALFNFYIVTEDFYLTKPSAVVKKIYIVVKASELFALEESEDKSLTVRVVNSEEFNFKLKLLSKSTLVVSHYAKDKVSLSTKFHKKFFYVVSAIMKIGIQGKEVERWQRLVKFSGEKADLYPLLEVGDECELRLAPLEDGEVLLKKSKPQSVNCISSYQEAAAECVSLPDEISITKVSSEKMKLGEESVQQVIESQGHRFEYFTVTGIVVSKCFMTPKYDSEISAIPLDICNNYHIGVPKSKQIRLLVRDENKEDCKIWLYITCTKNNFNSIYPLFVIPGVKIIATYVRRMLARGSGNVYLMSSDLTSVVPLSFPYLAATDDPTMSQQPKYTTLINVSAHTSTFIIFASVYKIMKASLKTVCYNCGYDIVQDSRVCFNCQATTISVKLEASAEVFVDDGTSCVLLSIKGIKHFQTLFRIPQKKYKQLEDLLLSTFLHLEYVANGSQGCHDDGITKAFRKIVLHRQLVYPYKFTCRKEMFEPYVCLDISFIQPRKDVILMMS